jgi:MoaA/NifB/PqqE/SkfB family radical SAM enzyme
LTKLKTIGNVAKSLIGSIPLNLGLSVKPKYLWLETTDRCNSRCTTCNIWKKPHTSNEQLMSLEDLKRCLTDPLMSKVKYVLNSGGESTLINLEDYLYVEHTALPKAVLQISSNALLPERLASIVQYAMTIGIQHLDVGLSIDGVGEAHDLVRGVPGNFVKLEETIKLLSKLKQKYPQRIFLSMGSTLTDFTAKQDCKLYVYCKMANIPFMWHWFNTSSFYENTQRSDKELLGVINGFPEKNLYMDSWRKSLVTGKIPKFRCHALDTFMAVKCNGEVVPCLSRWAEPIGNIKHQSISEIWRTRQAVDERLKIKQCQGCLNSWGWSWSVNETYYPVLFDVLKRKVKAL